MIPTPQGTNDKDQACLPRIRIRNRLCSRRDSGAVEIRPFIVLMPQHSKLALVVGPSHFSFCPYGSPVIFPVFAPMSLPREAFPTTPSEIAVSPSPSFVVLRHRYCPGPSLFASFVVHVLIRRSALWDQRLDLVLGYRPGPWHSIWWIVGPQ